MEILEETERKEGGKTGEHRAEEKIMEEKKDLPTSSVDQDLKVRLSWNVSEKFEKLKWEHIRPIFH